MARRATCWTRASLLFPGNFSRVAGIELPPLELSKNSRRALAAGKLFVQPRPPAGPRRSPDAGPADTAASTGRVCEPYMCAPSAVSFCHRETPGQVSSFLGGGCHWQVCRARRRRVFGAQINFKTGLTLTHAPPPPRDPSLRPIADDNAAVVQGERDGWAGNPGRRELCHVRLRAPPAHAGWHRRACIVLGTKRPARCERLTGSRGLAGWTALCAMTPTPRRWASGT
jgi:hypothetical protein